MKHLLFVVTMMLSLGSFAQTKIGHVNSQKLLDTLPSRKDALKKLDDFKMDGMKELQEMQKAFEASYAKFMEKEKDMSPVLRQMEEDKLRKKQQDIETRQSELEQQMQVYNEELNKPILDRIQKSVEIIAERKKLNYIIDESVTLYFKGGIDCTPEVMIELLKLDAESMKK
jgi:outer membrane protein